MWKFNPPIGTFVVFFPILLDSTLKDISSRIDLESWDDSRNSLGTSGTRGVKLAKHVQFRGNSLSRESNHDPLKNLCFVLVCMPESVCV